MDLNKIRKQFDDEQISHITVKPKTLTAISPIGTFSIEDEYNTKIQIKFTEQGAGCFQWLWRGKTVTDEQKEFLAYRAFTNDFNKINNEKLPAVERKISLANFMNRYKTFLNVAIKENELVTFHMRKNVVYGITRKYNIMIDHDDILDLIEDGGYSQKIHAAGLNNKVSYFDLKVKDSNSDLVIRVANGWTGHENLSYRVRMTFNKKYTFEGNLISKNRHLKNLKLTFKNLEEVMNEISKNNLADKLAKIDYETMKAYVFDIFTKREKFKDCSSNDSRKKLSKISEKQVEKMTDYINMINKWKVPSKNEDNSVYYIRVFSGTQVGGISNSVEILLNAVLNEIFDDNI